MDLELKTEAEKKADEAQKYPAFSGMNLRHVRGEIAEALTQFGKFGLLDEYTKHDITHIDQMLKLYEWMIPSETKKLMTPADWLLLVLSTYLHDFGLLATRDEFDARESVQAYLVYRRRIVENDDPDFRDYRAQVAQMEVNDAERFMYQEFVRANHAHRIRAWLQDTPDPSFGIDHRITDRLKELLNELEETFREDVALVCESHHLDDMNDTSKYPLRKPYGSSREEEANVQYAAFLLRTADLLHITKDRVPSMAALVVNPRNPKSQVEWAKQKAVRSVRPFEPPVNPDLPDGPPQSHTIEVHATFKEDEGYFGLTAYLAYAQKQIAQTAIWSSENQANGVSNYEFPWRHIDISHIEAKGFVSRPFGFTIDQGKILDLLTGHTLYNDTGVVVRELIQNSLDAVRLEAHLLQDQTPVAEFKPRIDVIWNSKARTLTVTDNGIGMSQSVIEQNFLRVGSSRYQEPEFQKEFPKFSSISRFGIGVLSTFMVADDVSVSTSFEGDAEARQLSLRDVHGQYLVRLVEKQGPSVPEQIRAHGTSVTLKLRPSAHLVEVEAILNHWIVVPGCEVWLHADEDEPQRVGFESVSDALVDSLVRANIVRLEGDKMRTVYGEPVEIRTVKRDGLDIAFAVSWNRWVEEWGYVTYDFRSNDFDDLPDAQFGICVSGVRVTNWSPGFRASGIAAIANAFGKGAPRTNVARSAIERTEEYDNLLKGIFTAYVGHIADEMRELEEKRDASLTRAAQEASYLTAEVARHDPESLEIRNSVFRTIPAIVVEEGGVRAAHSLVDLATKPELATIESTTISNFENVLRSVRGAKSASLRNLIDALGSDESLPGIPLVCGLTRSGFVNNMFTSEWEVVRLETDEGERTLRATWQRKTEDPRWAGIGRRNLLPPGVASRMQREAAVGRVGNRLTKVLFAAQPDQIDVGGITKSLVRCQGRLLVLPGSNILTIKPVSDEVPGGARLWCIAWLITALSGDGAPMDALSRVLRASTPEVRRDTEWMTRFLDNVRSSGVFEVLDEQSVQAVLADTDLEPMDVLRWDSRTPD